MWGIQLSSGYGWSRTSQASARANNLGLTTVDLDAVWNITPQYPVVAYVLAGAGYAWANGLDEHFASPFLLAVLVSQHAILNRRFALAADRIEPRASER
jgi:hypothetical protein